jgi:hypothetical protein
MQCWSWSNRTARPPFDDSIGEAQSSPTLLANFLARGRSEIVGSLGFEKSCFQNSLVMQCG